MEEINEAVFNFSKTDALVSVTMDHLEVENFDGLGLEGLNFIELSGSLIINFMLLVVIGSVNKLIQKVCVFFYKYKWARYIGMKTNLNLDVVEGIQNMYITAYLDIIICCFITMAGNPLQDEPRASDIFAYVFSIFVFVGLII